MGYLEPHLMAIARHRSIAPQMYERVGLSKLEEDAMKYAIQPFVDELERLADIHHRTIGGSRLHDPENIEDISQCNAITCKRVTKLVRSYS
jgi:hypothetical protein